MGFLDSFVSDPTTRNGLADSLGAVGLSLMSSPGNAPFAGMPQAMAIMSQQQRSGTSRAALKTLLMQAGYPEAQAEQLASTEGTAKLALDQKRREEAKAFTAGAFNDGPVSNFGMGAGATPGPGRVSFLDGLIGKESGGDANARNPNSSASGLTQFTDGTWEQMRKLHPDLGLTADGRSDPGQSKRAALAYAQDNGKLLAENGHAVTDGNLYLGHFLGGPGASRFLTGLQSNPNAPAASYADPASVAANRSVFYNPDGSPKSAQAFYNERTSRFGNAPLSEGRVRVADASGTMPSLPPGASGLNPARPQPQQASPADLPAPGAQQVDFIIPGTGERIPSGPAQVPVPPQASAAPNQTRAYAQQQLNRAARYIAASGAYGEDGKAVAEALKLRIQPLLKFLEPTEIERTLDAAGVEGEARKAMLRNSVSDNRPTSIRETEYALENPERRELLLDMKRAGGTNVTVGGQEKSYDAAVGKSFADNYTGLVQAGRAAQSQLGTFRVMEKLMDSPGFQSGTGSTPYLAFQRAAVGLGIADAAKAAPNELFSKLANQSVVDKLGGSLGAGVSNSDVSFLQRTTANLENTAEGNRQIIQFSKAIAQRQIEIARKANAYAAKHGGRIDAGFDDELATWAEANPLFPAARQGEQKQTLSPADQAASLANARAFIKANPAARDKALQRLRDAGLPTEGL